jgi:hypothetical protein
VVHEPLRIRCTAWRLDAWSPECAGIEGCGPRAFTKIECGHLETPHGSGTFARWEKKGGARANKCPQRPRIVRCVIEMENNLLTEKPHMSTQSPNQYLLLFRGTGWDQELSPEEIQDVMGRWTAWFEHLSGQGKLKSGLPLYHEGKVVSGKNGRSVADGPFAESKEAIGGFFLVQADDLDEALRIAKQCPGLDYGVSVEVRPVAESCPVQRAREQRFAHATA